MVPAISHISTMGLLIRIVLVDHIQLAGVRQHLGMSTISFNERTTLSFS